MKYTLLQFNIPDLNRTFVSGAENYGLSHIINGNINMLKEIEKDYGTIVKKWSEVFELDIEIINSFIATESGGKNRPANKFGATGPMQMTVNAVAESVVKWKAVVKSNLPTEAINFLNKKASFMTKLTSEILTATNKTKVKVLLTDEEFNIMIGCLYLRWLIERFKFFNKVMVAYNAGPYNSTLLSYGKQNVSSEALVINKSIPIESRNYIVKMLGVNGFMDLMLKNKLA